MVAARSALQAGDTATAIAGYSEAIEARDLAPEELANALINRGYAYQQAGEYERAADDYTAALRIDAMSGKLRATTLYNRGLSQQKLKHPVLAIEDFTSALFLEPEFAHAYYLRGTILRENGQLLFALSDFEKAIRFKHPQPHLAYYGEALAYEQLHRIDEAQAALNKAIAADPSFAPARDKLSELGALPAMSEVTVPQDEELTTASIASPEQIVRKQELPEAVKPPAELVSELPVQMVKAVPVRPAKLFNDRIPPEDIGSMAAAASEPVTTEEPAPASEAPSEYTLQADAIPEPNETKPEVAKSAPVSAKPVEQIVAVEALPEPAAQKAPAAEEASIEPAGEQVTAPAEQEASLTGWTIQLSSAKDEKLAWGTWDKLKTRHKALSGMTPVVVRADLGTKGIYYRLRLGGFDSQADAQSLCGKLKSRGLSCFVSKASS
jgi:tetratricopeptide (TPR) repeat protein